MTRLHVFTPCVLFLAGSLAAQSPVATVHGVAFDSVHSTPLDGAFIRMSGGSGVVRTTTSDAHGEFQFDQVAPGTYTFAALHEALDSLGFSGISAKATIGGGPTPASVRIAVPSFATLWRAACGAHAVSNDTGFVFGTVRDAESEAPLANATVIVRWTAMTVDTIDTRVAPQTWGGETKTDSTGGYTLCGVPADATLRLLASKDSSASGLVELIPRDAKGRRVERRDLLVGPMVVSPSMKTGVIEGIVQDESGAPVAGARVLASGADEVRTWEDGRFVVPRVPVGTREVVVMDVGSQPFITAADVWANRRAVVAVHLRRMVDLATVEVTAKEERQKMLTAYYQRRDVARGAEPGRGAFADSTRISQFEDLRGVVTFFAHRACPLYVDGIKYSTTEAIESQLDQRRPQSIALLEVHLPMDPTIVNVRIGYDWRVFGELPCHADPTSRIVLLWTKAWLP